MEFTPIYLTQPAYGGLKTWKALNGQGIKCGKHRVQRLRRENKIEARRRKRFKITTNSRHNNRVEPNLLNRCFKTDRPNAVWVGDVTFIATRRGWMYLSVMLDLYSRKVIGWSMSGRNDKHLVLNALSMALARRKPAGQVMHHTDRGSNYTCQEYQRKLADERMLSSMSRKAECYDNAVAESFFSTLKNELMWDNSFESHEQAQSAIFEYIEIFYNRQRIHQSLNYITPEMMELQFVS